MQTIEILMGVVGAGKSTMAKELAQNNNAIILAYDEIRKEYVKAGVIPKVYDSKYNYIVYDELHKRIENNAKEGKSIIVDATNIPASNREPIIQIAKKYHCKISGRVLLLDDEKCIERVLLRQNNNPNSHYIANPREAVQIYKERLKKGWPTLEEGFDQIIVYDDGKIVDEKYKIVIASTNTGKVQIYSLIFNELGLYYTTLKELNVNIDLQETGKTEEENAVLKAKAYHEVTKLPVLVNDSGLVIEKFKPDDQPGVFVRRYGGGELTDEDMIKIYAQKLKDVGGESDSYFKIALAICNSAGQIHTKIFKSYRYMISKPSNRIIKGLPLRSLDFNKELGKYWSEMSIEEANQAEGACMKEQKEFIKKVLKNI